MKLTNNRKLKRPKKFTHNYKDFKYLTLYAITHGGQTTPEETSNWIHENDWLKEDSDHRDYPSILKAVQAAWAGAKIEMGEIGKATAQPKLTQQQRLEIAIDYVTNNVVYDTLKNKFLNPSGNETSPADVFLDYNHMGAAERFIEKRTFDIIFESLRVPHINPVHIWGDNLPKWDKKDHIKKLCATIPAENPKVFELFLKSWMVRAYIQAVNPFNGTDQEKVNRHFLILQSDMESSGKSSFLAWLCPNKEWVKVSGLTPGKDGIRALAEYMIVVDDEMSGITQFKEHDGFKAMVSMPRIDVRLPYARRDSSLDRIASFSGSCNKSRIFPVGEHNTRFLCVALKDKMLDYQTYTKMDRTKIWSQVKALSESSWLADNEKEINELRTITNLDFEKESIEQDAIRFHFRLLTNKDIEIVKSPQGEVLQPVIQTTDVATLLNGLVQYTNIKFNLNTLGAVLTKEFGKRINGYRPADLLMQKEGEKYRPSAFRTRGYPIYFLGNTGA